MRCPICDNLLETYKPKRRPMVLDGNTVRICTKNAKHSFWTNGRDKYHIYYSPNPSTTSFKHERKWRIEGEYYDIGESNYHYVEEQGE